ncbi:MAG TPA: aldolase/citrate lyase family protein [Dehalococcoidia bacterium]|nr:aldolase/citrate lyase family protein [Dehalococcoidia bacterium]
MRENAMRKLWQEDRPALGGWLSIPSAFSAEVMAHHGLDWLCVDMQHGLIDYETALAMLQAISTTETTPIVRVPWNDQAIIMKMLDAGAYGVIVPMVNTRADAEAAVAACRYPPQGIRSFGPIRAVYYAGFDYFAYANREVCCIPQIETATAVENLDEILSVPGVDAVYIGPMDLSISLGLPPQMDSDVPAYAEARQRILEACQRHGVAPGINSSTLSAPKRIAEGFRLVLVTTDFGSLIRAVAEDIRSVRQASPGGPSGPAYQ